MVLGVLVAVGALSMTVSALQQAGGQAPMVVEVEKLKDNLYMMKGGGGNSAVFITANGVTVVDTKNPGWGQPLLDKIKSVTDRPITRIINTHTHGDHVSGNVEFPANIEIVAHANTAENMKAMRPAASIPQQGTPRNIFQEHKGHGLPTKTYKDKMTIGSGNERIELFYFGRAHTNGDTWVLFPAARIVHAADVFSGKNLPLLDSNNGGSGVEIGPTIEKAASAFSSVADNVITGHSTVMTLAELREYAQFNKDFASDMAAAKKAGKSVDEVFKTYKIPAKYAGYAPPAEMRLRSNIQLLYNETR
jgi:glyoxylase-like metal-dependent hydrolase (beta-lactamase superfamily II)